MLRSSPRSTLSPARPFANLGSVACLMLMKPGGNLGHRHHAPPQAQHRAAPWACPSGAKSLARWRTGNNRLQGLTIFLVELQRRHVGILAIFPDASRSRFFLQLPPSSRTTACSNRVSPPPERCPRACKLPAPTRVRAPHLHRVRGGAAAIFKGGAGARIVPSDRTPNYRRGNGLLSQGGCSTDLLTSRRK